MARPVQHLILLLIIVALCCCTNGQAPVSNIDPEVAFEPAFPYAPDPKFSLFYKCTTGKYMFALLLHCRHSPPLTRLAILRSLRPSFGGAAPLRDVYRQSAFLTLRL